MVGTIPYRPPYHHMHASLSHHVSTLMSLPECVPSSVLGPSMQLRRQKQLQKRKEIPLRANGCAKITKIHARRHRMASSLVTVNNNPTKDPNGRSIHPSIHPSVRPIQSLSPCASNQALCSPYVSVWDPDSCRLLAPFFSSPVAILPVRQILRIAHDDQRLLSEER